ncbi:putative efflux pump [Lachnellula hyalina]|uniref:Putative efflux pump n=1 Tax=Lachnellula hyalina TaxID=1316788 RepID=A0A8H8R3Q9_9HELO|nr:putative efflux pump [Lachnellula hyalina]TVY27140.1 putative efflux pump [Lachnellula hyalina]
MESKPTQQAEATHDNGVAEKAHAAAIDSSHLENGIGGDLSSQHREYLMTRHGTIDLNPLPSMDPADPLNWPTWKKHLNLILVAFHAMMTTFTAAGIIPAFELFSIDLGVSLTKASYLTSVQILILGFSPLFWKPISNRFGRRPIWLISTIGSLVCNVGCAKSHSYASQMITRILVAFFISPAIAISSAVVTETFFASERGQKMGIWTLMVTLGPPMGPFIMGFVAYHTHGWEYIYWTFAVTNGVQFILYFFFSPETLYVRSSHVPQNDHSSFRRQYLNFGKLGPNPLGWRDFWMPIKLFAYPNILLPTIAYSIVFGFTSVLLTVEIPQIFTPKFGFNAQQIGLQFAGMIIGSVLGEQLGGRGSDIFMRRRSAKLGQSKTVTPEHRLWVSYPGYATGICGLVVFCVQTDKLKSYNVTPIVGIAIAAFGNQIITTVLVTYAVDCHHEHAASIGVFINLVRSTWGFIGPFWFPDMFTSIGLSGSGGLMVGIMVVFSILPTMFIQWKGAPIRTRRADKELDQVNTTAQ